jgi:hypothetical protein
VAPGSPNPLVWDIPVNLAAGDNPVAFNTSNSLQVQ